ncbi:MAG: VCBS repeat-containing protein [Planctomycetes bacterium]|nr:VCBS repeat-containing protein [Planctomycetota bacterium]
MKPRLLLAAALCLGICAGTSHAVDPISPVQIFDGSYTIPIRPLGDDPTPSISRTIAGLVDADENIDCVVLQNGRPVLYTAPGLFDAPIPYPAATAGTADIALIRTGLSAELLTVNGDGLVGWTLSDGVFTSRQLGTVADWATVEQLRCADVNGDGRRDVIGYKWKNGHKLLVLLDEGLPTESLIEISIGREPLAIVPFQRTTQKKYIAVLTTLGVGVYHITPTGSIQLTDYFLQTATDGAMTAVDFGSGVEQLAWIYRESGTEKLRLIENDQGALTLGATALDIGSLEVVAARAADVDGNGSDDVVLTHRSSYTLEIFLSDENDAFGLDALHHRTLALSGGDASANEGWVAISDFDADGDLDAFCPASEDLVVHIVENLTVVAEHQYPIIDDLSFGYAVPGYPDNYLRVTFRLPVPPDEEEEEPGDVEVVPDGATHWEVICWRKQSLPTHTGFLGDRYLLALDAPAPTEIIVALANETGPSLVLPSIYFWTARYVEADLGDPDLPTLKGFPASVHGWTTDDDPSEPLLEYLTGLPGWIATNEVPIEWGSGSLPPPHPRDTTNDTEVKPIPDFDDDPPPNDNGGNGNGH